GRFSIGEQLLARDQIPFAPRRNDLDARFERIVAEFESHLIVALAGGAMRDSVALDLACDLDLALRNEGARNGRTQQVLAFVHRVHAKHGEDEITHELFAEVVNEYVFGLDAELERFGARGFEFVALA